MNKIEENIKLLSIFHYAFAGLVAAFSCIPIIHIILGVIMLVSPETMCSDDCKEAPPEFLGWIFIGIGAFVMMIGFAFAGMVVATGRFLARRRHHKFCIAVAAVCCLFMPIGTVLGVFTLITLTKPEAESLFA
jgi:hypothetical protein